jgi:AraC family transcriptional regulator
MWVVAAFASDPVIEHPEWHVHTPQRIIMCPSPQYLRPSRVVSTELHLRRADLWVLPADWRTGAVTLGPVAEVCEILLPLQPFDVNATTSVIRRRHPFTLHLVEHMRQLAKRNDLTARLLTASLTEALRLHLIDRFTPAATPHRHGTRHLTHEQQIQLLNHIDTPGGETDTSVATLAELVGMTVGGFTRAFAAAFPSTPHQFILDRRISHAKTLLNSTDRSITEISAALGFATHSHFSTTFKKRTGLTPAQYRTTIESHD